METLTNKLQYANRQKVNCNEFYKFESIGEWVCDIMLNNSRKEIVSHGIAR